MFMLVIDPACELCYVGTIICRHYDPCVIALQFAPNNYCTIELSSSINIWMSSVFGEMAVPHCVWKWMNFVWKWMFALLSLQLDNYLTQPTATRGTSYPTHSHQGNIPTATRGITCPAHATRGDIRPSPHVGLVGCGGHPNPLVGWFCCGTNALLAKRSLRGRGWYKINPHGDLIGAEVVPIGDGGDGDGTLPPSPIPRFSR
jgi:hypothetical protein